MSTQIAKYRQDVLRLEIQKLQRCKLGKIAKALQPDDIEEDITTRHRSPMNNWERPYFDDYDGDTIKYIKDVVESLEKAAQDQVVWQKAHNKYQDFVDSTDQAIDDFCLKNSLGLWMIDDAMQFIEDFKNEEV